ncbi:unnamed protein product [Tetraodon nigroviridis]|uniref:(spotted green pufferfish) hypothetical protein n=1 Tax=Tetraodon nigroviridis TaxID=99883 RepID=Q4RE56_TETNG|nr:unnamed protein product [Tetraodon nigroviridis]
MGWWLQRCRDTAKVLLSKKVGSACGRTRGRRLAGLRKEDIYNNLRIPDQFQTTKDDINIIILTECELNEELKKREELVTYDQIDDFLGSFREGYVAWISDALTPSWISGHFSYRQMESIREILGKVGTWDLVRLRCGEQLRGDYRGCQYIALNRQETDMLAFSGAKTLSSNSLWALLGHTPQVTVKLYKRGSQGWLGKSLSATATIPSNAFVIFRIGGEEADTKIPADTIHSVTLSM